MVTLQPPTSPVDLGAHRHTPRVEISPTARELIDVHERAKTELHKILVGMEEVVNLTLAGLYNSSHVLIQGAPGLAKTLLAKNVANVMGLSYGRTQFTSDLLPADITGGLVLPSGARDFVFRHGPIFKHVYMADEINRTPPKTQSALLEAMQEHQVTIDGTSHQLPSPFFVVATQNEIGTEGTFPLPHAQLDRFGMKVVVPLPGRDQMIEIGRRTTNGYHFTITPVLDSAVAASRLAAFKTEISKVSLTDEIEGKIADVVLALSPSSPQALEDTKKYIQEGPLVRGQQSLIMLCKTFAILDGRMNVSLQDIARGAFPALHHRVALQPFSGKASSISIPGLIDAAVKKAVS